MINQPWKSRNWFTYTPITAPKVVTDVFRPSTKKHTINLADVQGWEITPSNKKPRKQGPPTPDICKVTLASSMGVRLYSGTIMTSNRSGNKGTIEIDQITDFFDAMRSAKLI